MRVVDVQVPTAGNSRGIFNLFPIGDMHLERREFNRKRFIRYRDEAILADPERSVAVFVGDATEGRTPGMKHFDPDTLRPRFLENLGQFYRTSLDEAERLLKPITKAGIPLVIVEGNHDEYPQFLGYSAALADRVGGLFLGGAGFARVRSGASGTGTGYNTIVFCAHGTGGGKTAGPKVNAMENTLLGIDADIVVKGHVHDSDTRIIERYGVPKTGEPRIITRPTALVRAGSFMEYAIPGAPVGYQVKKEFRPGDRGLIYLKVDPQERKMSRRECDF